MSKTSSPNRTRLSDCNRVKKIKFYSVSLIENIPTLLLSVSRINQFYNSPSFTIICPENDRINFKHSFGSFKNVTIISESHYLTLERLEAIAASLIDTSILENHSRRRLRWYYQQILKITYLLDKIQKHELYVMWDADTVPTKKIIFFKENQAQLYGSLVEFHRPYFETLGLIFKQLPANFLAFTIQFFNCNYNDAKYLQECLNSYIQRDFSDSIAEWISKIVIKSTLERHGSLINSGFSEQELVGLATLLNNGVAQKSILYLRNGFNGILTSSQILFVKIFGFKHISYENNSRLIKHRQTWMSLIALVFKQLIRQKIIFKKEKY